MDKPVLGAKAGLLSGVIVGTVSAVLNVLGVCQLCLIKTGGGFFAREMITSNEITLWTFLGWVNHLIISIILGIIWVYFIYYTGKDYAVVKGLILGIIFWMINYSFISPLTGYIPKNSDPLDLTILLIYHAVFGIITAWYIVRYGRLVTRSKI